MKQEKQIMSNSYMRAASKKQHKLMMKQARERNSAYESERMSIINELRSSPWIHDFNNMDY